MITISTRHPIALHSPDHLYPFGTARDSSTNPRFNQRLYEVIPAPEVRLLDLGCAGGGLVKSILDDGGFAVGIDGSTYSQVMARAEWATIPEYLFTADVTEPFQIYESDPQAEKRGPIEGALLPHVSSSSTCETTLLGLRTWKANVITAWEVFEHIAEPDIPAVVANIKRHLDPGGFFIGSINPQPHPPYHQTLRPKPWWVQRFFELGFFWYPQMELKFDRAMVRDEGFPIALRASFAIHTAARPEPE